MKTKLSQDRQDTLSTVKKITDYEDLNLYSMECLYSYDLENLIKKDVHDTQTLMEMAFQEAIPDVQIDYVAPDYGCSAFRLIDEERNVLMGRNYDFKFDSSAMMVLCHPENGYASVAHAALDNVKANDPFESEATLISCLTAPFICIDGINEKGVGIAVLTLDSDPVNQCSGKPVLATTILIRLVLDQAASTEEAVELLKNYDMYAISGRDYHFYITDATGDGRVVEFDCDSEQRNMVVTPTDIVTNFYIMYESLVMPNQKNGVYGHGRERYDAIEKIFADNGYFGNRCMAWKALKAAAQEPNPESITSNTQWSIVYDLSNLNYEFVLHRKWEDKVVFKEVLINSGACITL